MSKYFVFIMLSACCIFLPLPGFAAADDRVCVYKHENFHGHEQCYRPGDEVSDLKHAEISSIQVFGHARAMVYADPDFRVRVMETTKSLRDLKHVSLSGSKSLEDHIGSLRVTSDYDYSSKLYSPGDSYGRYKPYPTPGAIDEGVCVYDKPNFEGRQQRS